MGEEEEVIFDEVLTRIANLAEDCTLERRVKQGYAKKVPDPSSGLFLGIRAAAESVNILRQHNITTTISVGTWPERIKCHQKARQRSLAIRLPGSKVNEMRIEECAVRSQTKRKGRALGTSTTPTETRTTNARQSTPPSPH